MAMNQYLSIITLSVNGLNASIKRHRIAEWIRKHEPHLCCLQETHLMTKDLHRLKERVENKYSKKMDRKKRWGKRKKVILISDKVDFKRRAIKRHPEVTS